MKKFTIKEIQNGWLVQIQGVDPNLRDETLVEFYEVSFQDAISLILVMKNKPEAS